jgi:hypothetical protein
MNKKTGRNGNRGNPGPGRPKGSINKFTTLKQAFLDAFEHTGGTKGLIEWIEKHPRNRADFYKMVTKLLPQDTNVSGDVKLDHALTIKVVQLTDKNGNGNTDK